MCEDYQGIEEPIVCEEPEMVEVGRCKDCKRKSYCMIFKNHLGEEEFCSLGERK